MYTVNRVRYLVTRSDTSTLMHRLPRIQKLVPLYHLMVYICSSSGGCHFATSMAWLYILSCCCKCSFIQYQQSRPSRVGQFNGMKCIPIMVRLLPSNFNAGSTCNCLRLLSLVLSSSITLAAGTSSTFTHQNSKQHEHPIYDTNGRCTAVQRLPKRIVDTASGMNLLFRLSRTNLRCRCPPNWHVPQLACCCKACCCCSNHLQPF